MEKIEIIKENYEIITTIALQASSITDICYKLGYTYNTSSFNKVKKFIEETNFDKNVFKINSNKNSDCIFNNEIQFKKIVAESISYSDVLKRYNKKLGSGNFVLLKKYIVRFNVDISHFNPNKRFKESYYKIKDKDELFCKDSQTASQVIRNRVIKENLLEYKCANPLCGNTGSWFGQPMSLQLDHINGDNKDNRLENLRFLCPNCHCVTPTWGNKRSYKKVQYEKLDTHKLFALFEEVKDIFLSVTINNLNTGGEILRYFDIGETSHSYNALKKILDVNKSHPNVINFQQKQIKNFDLYSIAELVEKLQTNSFVKVAKELNCSDNGLRNHLKKNGIDVKNIKKTKV